MSNNRRSEQDGTQQPSPAALSATASVVLVSTPITTLAPAGDGAWPFTFAKKMKQMTMQAHRGTDPRTTQFVEVLTALVVMSSIHTFCYFSLGRYTFSVSYDLCVVIAGCLTAVFAAMFLRRSRSWHVGQIAVFVSATLVLILVHLIFHPALIGDLIWRSLDDRGF